MHCTATLSSNSAQLYARSAVFCAHFGYLSPIYVNPLAHTKTSLRFTQNAI